MGGRDLLPRVGAGVLASAPGAGGAGGSGGSQPCAGLVNCGVVLGQRRQGAGGCICVTSRWVSPVPALGAPRARGACSGRPSLSRYLNSHVVSLVGGWLLLLAFLRRCAGCADLGGQGTAVPAPSPRGAVGQAPRGTGFGEPWPREHGALDGRAGDRAAEKAPPGQDLSEFQARLVFRAEPFKGPGCSAAADECVSRLLLLK